MDVQHERTDHRGKFFIKDQDAEVAKMTYVFAGDTKFIIDHTEVEESHKGEGLGSRLVDSAVEYAREHGYKVLPLCPYAKSVFDKRPEVGDVLS